MHTQKAWCAQAVSDQLRLASTPNCSEFAMGRWAGLPRWLICACAISLTLTRPACTGPVTSFLYMQKAHLSGSFLYPAALSGHWSFCQGWKILSNIVIIFFLNKIQAIRRGCVCRNTGLGLTAQWQTDLALVPLQEGTASRGLVARVTEEHSFCFN